MKCFKKGVLLTLSIFLFAYTNAQVYYVSSSLGDDQYDGLDMQSPIQSIEKLNSMVFSPGDTIYFKSGDYWEGMFWLSGSGSLNQPIVIDIYGGSNRAIINGFGYQASIFVYNEEYIEINQIPNSFF